MELGDLCLAALCLRLRPLKGLARLVNRFPGNGRTLRQGLVALEGRFRLGEFRFVLFEPSLGCCQVGSALIYDDLIGARIDFRAELARLHLHVGVAIERLDHAGHARADRRGRRGTDDAARGAGNAGQRSAPQSESYAQGEKDSAS